jgi:hypothetical protein
MDSPNELLSNTTAHAPSRARVCSYATSAFPAIFLFFHRGACQSVTFHIAALNTVCTRNDKTMHTTRIHKLQNTHIIIKMLYLVTCFASAKLLRVLKHKGILGLGVNSRDSYPPPRLGLGEHYPTLMSQDELLGEQLSYTLSTSDLSPAKWGV